MRITDIVRGAFQALAAHKLRTFLTMFGIAWGMISITLMVGAGEGLRAGQQKQADNLGKNIIITFPGRTSMHAGGERAGRRIFFERPDAENVAGEAFACKYVVPEHNRGIPVRSRYNNATPQLVGSVPAFADIRSIPIERGRFYSEEDVREARRVVFLGAEVRKQLFGGRNPLGEAIYIKDYPYTVVGEMTFKDQDSSYNSRDVNNIFLPITAMQRDFPDPEPFPRLSIDELLIQPHSLESHEECKWQVKRALGRIHNFDPNDKDAASMWDTVENQKQFRQMTDGMKYFLGAVGIVTLLLGGIGVMNVMLVSVRERTREIGVRKAVGATRGAIVRQFFLEALIIVLVSGGFGIGIAYGICAAVNTLPMPPFFDGLKPTLEISLGSFALLGVTALFAGIYPAAKAASIDPIEALRFEPGS
jgi:putative ABC transport system permease protein